MKTKKYFELNTKRIALLAMLLVLNIICELISQYILVLGKIGGFLSFSITLWTVILCYLAINGFYAVILLETTTWIRVGMSGDPISGISLNLSDLSFLLIFMVIVYIGKLIEQKINKTKNEKWGYFIILMTAMATSTLITSGLDVVYNKYFLINWWWQTSGSKIEITSGLLITIFWFNVVEFAINIAIFGSIYNAAYILTKRYNA